MNLSSVRCRFPHVRIIVFDESHCSQGLVKAHGPDDLRTELKDVSVFRMDVHVPSPPEGAKSQVCGAASSNVCDQEPLSLVCFSATFTLYSGL